jgi:2-oxoglutarate ferredoxin oxidoreductase subunit alpha
MRGKHGLKMDLCRVRAYPFTKEVEEFITAHERTYVVEINRDAQMRTLLGAEFPNLAPKLRSLLHYDGMPLAASTVVTQYREAEAAWGEGTRE